MSKKTIHIISAAFFFLTLLVTSLLVLIHTSQATNETQQSSENDIVWGVNFSESQAEYLDLDAKETYQAIITDLKAKHIKIHINWNVTEPERGAYNFASLDHYVQQAEVNDVKLILVIGKKTGRWPECHTPQWFESVPEEERKAEIIRYLSEVVHRYKDSTAVEYWQVENEPFLEFGTCPDWYYEQDTSLVEALITTVRATDPARKIIVSESGELSTWTKAASLADIVGVTMYRSTWNAAEKTFGVNPYTFLAPEFYATKAAFIESYYQKPVISIELQAEPWTALPLKESALEIQAQSMNPTLFAENIEFAKQAKLGAYYLWGAEWWYWMKTKHNQPEIWNSATQLLAE